MKLSKKQVAVSQLDTAIELLFSAGDVVSTHTLAAASLTIFADLLKDRNVQGWTEKGIASFPGKETDARKVLARARNFFKHADNDPEAHLDFDEKENDAMIILATLEYGELLRGGPKKLSEPMSVFQLWYLANSQERIDAFNSHGTIHIKALTAEAQLLFPKLSKMPRAEQLKTGADVLRQQTKH
jgi:hypothetical protein